MASVNTSKIVLVTVYWDRRDWENQGWAYRAMDANDREESGSLRSNDLHEAVDEACEILGLEDHAVEFALSAEEGGYAMWSLPQ